MSKIDGALENWLEERRLEIKPAEKVFLRERALHEAARLIAEKLMQEELPGMEDALRKAIRKEVEDAVPRRLRGYLMNWLEDNFWKLVRDSKEDEDED